MAFGVVAPVTSATSSADDRSSATSSDRDAIEVGDVLARAIVETSVEAIVTVADDGTILSVNPAGARLFGYAPSEIVGTSVARLMDPAVASRHAGEVGRYLGGAPSQVVGRGREVIARHRDGSLMPVYLAVSPVRVGGRDVFVGMLHDLGELKEARELAARKAKEQAALRRAATLVAAETDLHVVLGRLTEEAARLAGARVGAIIREGGPHDGATIAVWCEDAARDSADGEGVRISGPGMAVPWPQVEDLTHLCREGDFGGRVSAPLIVDHEVWGILFLDGVTGGEPGWETDVLAQFGDLAAVAIGADALRSRLTALALTDDLTGLHNRRAFQERLEAEVSRAQTFGHPLSVVTVDVDHFKFVNDLHGHAVGDAVLVEVARRLKAAARTGDLVARVGGEEFAWVLPEANAREAMEAAERARRAMSADPYTHGERLTISAGVCDLDEASSPTELLRLADVALYSAKELGRDRCVHYRRGDIDIATSQEREQAMERNRKLAVLRALAQLVDARDPSTQQHSERVATLVRAVAGECGWDPARSELLAEAALVHDIGKVAIPDHVLLKPGRLTPFEYAAIREHPSLGAKMLQGTLTDEQVNWVRHHHERLDGHGYPDELRGEQIPEGARLLAVADAWDAMTSSRSYSTARGRSDALVECEREAGTQFCPLAVAALRQVISTDSVTTSTSLRMNPARWPRCRGPGCRRVPPSSVLPCRRVRSVA